MSPDNVYEGRVSSVQSRWELGHAGQELVWDFRIERFDADRKPLPRVPVQLRGQGFDGAIKEGDLVRVQGTWAPGQTLHVNEVFNLTSGARVCPVNVVDNKKNRWISSVILMVLAFILMYLLIVAPH